jgi:copper(I)-binding protein
MPPMMKMTAAFMDIQNNSSQKVILLKVSSSLATNTELHTHIKNNNGTALMQKMQNITIEANSTNELIHGGDHVMIMGLNQKLKAGDMHTLIFHFSDGSSKEKQIMVKRL